MLRRRSESEQMESAIRHSQTTKAGLSGKGKECHHQVAIAVVNLLKYWNSLPGVRKVLLPPKNSEGKYINPTRTFIETARFIKKMVVGSAYEETSFSRDNRPFTLEEIRLSMSRFSKAVSNNRFYPVNKEPLKRMSVKDFFYNRFSKKDHYRSCFFNYLKDEPQLRMASINEIVKERMPALTIHLKKKYSEKFLGGLSTPINKNAEFVMASNSLWELVSKWEDEGKLTLPILSVEGLAERYLNALLEWAKRKDTNTVSPHTLYQPFAHQLFAEYLGSAGYFE